MPTLPELSWEAIGARAEGLTLSIFQLDDSLNRAGKPKLLVIGCGYWIRINPILPSPAYVMRQTSDLSHERADCTVADALPYLALAMRADDSRREDVLEALAEIIGPVDTIRFAAGLPPVWKGKSRTCG